MNNQSPTLLQATDGKKQHWLYPFRDRIVAFHKELGRVHVKIHTTMEELKLNTSEEALKALGITNVKIETPVVEVEDHANPYSLLNRSFRHTGEIIIDLTFDTLVGDNYLLTL